MAWKWPSSTKNGAGEEWTGFIDQGVTLEGTLTVTGTFRVDGNVKGNIISEQTVVLGEGAKVEGQIEGNRVVISGRFDGVIFAKGRVEIQAKGVVPGEVHAPCMVIDPGRIFDGRCHVRASSEEARGKKCQKGMPSGWVGLSKVFVFSHSAIVFLRSFRHAAKLEPRCCGHAFSPRMPIFLKVLPSRLVVVRLEMKLAEFGRSCE